MLTTFIVVAEHQTFFSFTADGKLFPPAASRIYLPQSRFDIKCFDVKAAEPSNQACKRLDRRRSRCLTKLYHNARCLALSNKSHVRKRALIPV
jgi:hypothetical protein